MEGPLLPGRLPARRMLSFYASRLGAVEVNATFRRMPRAAMLAGWRAEVPPGFVLALKAPQRITHFKRLRGAEDAVAQLHGAAAELGPALGPVLFQLPPDLEVDLPRLRDFLALLPRGGRAAFEFRHPSWLDDAVLALLAEHGAALCVAEDEDRAALRVATAGFGYLRLRRPNYDARAIARWLEWIHAQRWESAFVFFKHEDEARGPEFALAMARRLDGAGARDAAASP